MWRGGGRHARPLGATVTGEIKVRSAWRDGGRSASGLRAELRKSGYSHGGDAQTGGRSVRLPTLMGSHGGF
jgi:hypothetical protein